MGFLSDIQKKVSSGSSQGTSAGASQPTASSSGRANNSFLSNFQKSDSNSGGGFLNKVSGNSRQSSQTPQRTVTAPASSTRGMLAQIDNLYQTDKAKANEMFTGLQAAWGDFNSGYSRPYSGVTNKSKAILDSMGIDTSNINDAWYAQYDGYMDYLPRGQYTNDFSTPTKRQLRDPNVQIGNAVRQFHMAEDATVAAENEWAEAQKEMQYWLDSGLNLSDADIIKKLNISGNSKYKTLAKMDEARVGKEPMELNRAIGYNGEDDLYTVLWQMRNGGPSGNYMRDMINAGYGAGNTWVPDKDIQERLDPNSSRYNLYAVGMVDMDDAGAYFGQHTFDWGWYNSNYDPYNTDPTYVKMMGKVYEALDNSEKAKEQKAELDKYIERQLPKIETDEDVERVLRNIDWSDKGILVAIDKSLGKDGRKGNGKWVSTAEPFDYKYQDVVDRLNAAKEENAKKKNGDDTIAGFTPPEPEFVQSGEEPLTSEQQDELDHTVGTDTPSYMEDEIDAGEEPGHAMPTAETTGKSTRPPMLATNGPAPTPTAGARASLPPEKTGTQLTESTLNTKVKDSLDVMEDSMTLAERTHFQKLPGVEYDRIRHGMLQGPLNPALWEDPNFKEYNFRKAEENANKKFMNAALGSLETRRKHEYLQDEADRLRATIDGAWEKYGDQLFAAEEIPEGDLRFTMSNGVTVTIPAAFADGDAVELESGDTLDEVLFRQGVEYNEAVGAEIQSAIQQRNEDAERIRAAKEQYGEEIPEGMPTLEELNEMQRQWRGYQQQIEAGQEEYDKAVNDLDTARKHQTMMNDLLLRNGFDVESPADIDAILSAIEGIAGFQPPETNMQTLANQLHLESSVKLENGELAFGDRATTLKDIEAKEKEIDEAIADAKWLQDRAGDAAGEFAGSFDEYIGFLTAQKMQYEYYKFSLDKNFEKAVENGKRIEGVTGLGKMGFEFADRYEQDLYYGILGRYGQDAADKYYADIEPSLVARRDETIAQNAEEMAQSGFLGRALNMGVSIAMAPLDVLGSALDIVSVATTGKGNDWFRTASQISKETYNSTQQEIAKVYKDKPLLKDAITLVNEIVYNRGRSMAVGGVFGPFFPAGTGEVIQAMPIALTAADETLRKYLDAGVDAPKAAALATISFLSESLTEGIELGHIKQAFGVGQDITKNSLIAFFKDYIPNALPEIVGESVNDIAEKFADFWIAGYKGDLQGLMESYKAKGMSDDEAYEMMIRDQISDVAHTAFVSLLSPVMDLGMVALGEFASYSEYASMAKELRRSGANPTATVRSLRNGDRQMIKATQAAQEAWQNREPGKMFANEPKIIGPDITTAGFGEEAAQENTNQYDIDITVLDGLEESNQTTVTTSVAAVLSTSEADKNQAGAAAVGLGDVFGDDIIGNLQQLLAGGLTGDININILKKGIQMAAMADGRCRNIMTSDAFQRADPETRARWLAEAVAEDAQNQNVQNQVNDATHEFRVAEEEKRLMSEGAGDAAVTAKENIQAAKEETEAARDELEKRSDDVEAKQEAAKVAGEEAANNPTDENVNEAVKTTEELKKSVESEGQYQQHLDKTERQEKETTSKEQRTIDETAASIRQQAETTVRQQEQAEAQAAAEAAVKAQEEQARLREEQERKVAAEREKSKQARIDSARKLGEERADQKGLEGQEREDFVQRYVERAEKRIQQEANMDARIVLNENGEVDNAEGILALKSFTEKTGLNIAFQDLGDPRNIRGKYDGHGTVILNSQMLNSGSLTTGQALVEAALHEITHAFEGTKNYQNYQRTILDIMYGKESTTENNAELRDAVKKKIEDYRNAGIDLTQGGKITETEGAIREIVADYARTSDLHRKESVQRFIDAGLGGQMRNALHNINQALKNFMLKGDAKVKAENLRRAERAYQRGLNALAKESLHATGEQFSIPQFAQAAGLVFNEAEQTLTTKDGKVIDGINTHVTADMIKGTPMGRLIDGGIRAKTITEKDAGVIRDQFAKLMDMCAKYRNSQMIWEIAACTLESEFSAIKGNSDKQYSWTVDFGTICTKTQAIVDQLSRNMLAVGRGLTIKEILDVYNDVYESDLTVPCPVCYVFSRWMGVPSLLGSMKEYQDRFLGKPGENLTEDDIQRRVDEYIANAQEHYGIDKDFGKIVAERKEKAQAKVGKQKLVIADLEAILAIKQDALDQRRASGKTTKQAESQLLTAQRKLNEANDKLSDLKADLDNVEVGAYGKIINAKKSDIDGDIKKRYKKIEGEEGKPGLLQLIEDGKKAGKDVSALEESLSQLRSEIDDLYKELSQVDGYNWVTQALCKLDKNGRFVLDLASESNPNGFVRTKDEILLDLNRTAEFAKDTKNWRYRTTRGAGMGKAILPYSGASIGDSVYGAMSRKVVNSFLAAEEDTNAIDKAIESKMKSVMAQNLIGGQRFQSTSDFRPEWGLDYIMTFIEQQVLGSKGQLYTKVAEAVPLFAKAGIDTNCSVMPYGDGYHIDENGNVVLDFSDVTGMNADLAKSLKNQYSNVQLILVGINDTHITAALKDSDITFVIPWHSSGNTKGQLASMMASVKEQLNESRDYTKLQNDAKYEGETALVESATEKLKTGEDLTDQEVAALKREQKRNVREKILTGGFKHPNDGKSSRKRAPTKSEMEVIRSSEYLTSLYNRFYEDASSDCYGVQLTSSQASQIFPYEYWQMDPSKKGGRIETADENGRRFCEYCSELGYVPRFSGIDYEIEDENGKPVKNEDGTTKKGNYGNFSGMTVNEDGSRTYNPVEGYWKLLIDRRMYDNDGNYRNQQTISVNGLDVGEMEMNQETGRYELKGSDLNRTDINNGRRSKYRLDNPQIIEAHKRASERFDKRQGITQVAYDNDYQFSVYDDGGITDADIDQDLAADEDYMAAVERGEIETAQEDVNLAAEQAMQSSKVRDEDGNLLIVYHGTTEDFTVFDMSKGRSTMDIQGAFFSPYDIEAGGYGDKVGSYYLNITNPAPEDVAYAALNRYKGQNEAGKKAREYLISNGYDGVANYDEYIAFYPEQIKSADTITYDDQGNVIPLSERFQSGNPDVRYSAGGDQTDADIDQDLAASGITEQQAPVRELNQGMVDSGEITKKDLEKYRREQTRNPLEGQRKTMSTDEGTAVRAFAADNGMLDRSDELDALAKAVVMAKRTYFPDTNADQVIRALKWVRSLKTTNNSDGYAEALQAVARPLFDYRSADGQARMVAVMGLAAAKNDVMGQTMLADAFMRQGTDLGRALQARKLFKLMTPEGRISTLQKMLQNQQDILDAKGINQDLKFSEWIYMAAAAATEDGDFQKVQEAAAEELSEQLPASWKDKLRAWRMLSMLGNPRTHIRNIVGNALFIPAVSIKNKLGAVAELGMKQGNRTKTLNPFLSKEVRDFARQDAIAMKDELTGEAKYKENPKVQAEPFHGLLKVLSDFNSNMLEGEDWFFLKGHYRRALGGWIQANGYTIEQLQSNPELLEQGRAYAINEAQKATYRDFNGLAAKLNELTRNPKTTGQKALAFGVEAVLPFKKTPANILKRGLEYSPVGIARSLTTDIYHLKQYLDYQKGKLKAIPEKAISPNQFIDRLCSGLTGSGILMMGAFLANMGVVSCGLGDDDDEFEKIKGNQKYAIKFNLLGQDVTFTMDWAAPMSMPFFVGAAIQNMSKDEKGFSIDALVNAFGNITEPVFNLSMLDGVNSLLQVSQGEDSTLTQIAAKTLTNYVTSYIPSFVGAVARTYDDTSRKAYVESGKGSGVMGTLRYSYEQTQNKIPGWSQTNIPVRDVWGNAKKSGLAERILENFVLPGYIEQYKEDPVTNAMAALFEQTGSPDVVPKDPAKTFSAGGQKYVLTAEQWDTYKTVRGQNAYDGLNALIQTDEYQNSSDDAKVEMVKAVWDYANQKGKLAVDPANKEQRITVNRSEMNKALDVRDYEAFDTMIEALHQDGVDDDKITDWIGNKYRDQYKDAYRRNDTDRLDDLWDMFNVLSDYGITFNITGKRGWEAQVNSED